MPMPTSARQRLGEIGRAKGAAEHVGDGDGDGAAGDAAVAAGAGSRYGHVRDT